MAQLFIGQLPFSKFFPDDLLNLFRPYGNVVAHQLHIRQGNAFVTYSTTDEADNAIRALHGQCALGTRSQPIQVMYSKGTRLISPFGLQHRSLCLSRNKDRQKKKDKLFSDEAYGVINNNNNNNNNNDSVSLNEGAMSGKLCASQTADFSTILYKAAAEDASTVGNTSGAGVASSFLSRGPSDISFDEDGRAMMGSGVFSAASIHSLSASMTRQMQQQQQQQQQQQWMSGMLCADATAYGAPVKWSMSPSTLMPAPATPYTGSGNDGLVPSNGVCSPLSRLSSPAAPPVSSPAFSYVVMQPQQPPQGMPAGMVMPPGMPVCYVMPASAGQMYMPQQQQQQQQQHAFGMAPFGGATMLPPSLAYMQMRRA